MRTLIANGTVVNATGAHRADVLLEGERIVAVLATGSAPHLGITVDITVDAADRYVIPGAVDCHVHLQMPQGDAMSTDTFESGTIAAAHGGTTTVIDFAERVAGGSVRAAFEERVAEAEGSCVIDWGLHQVLGSADAGAIAEYRALADAEGVSSIKLFMAYPGLYSDDGQLLQALQMCSETGTLAMVHAENGPAIDVLRAQAVAAGRVAPEFHALTRPAALEAEAVHRAAVLAEVAGDAPLYIVHLSSSEALAEVVARRHRGANVFAETCPQYLYLSIEEHLRDRPDAAQFVCSTPLRSRDEPHVDHLWRGLRIDDLAVVSTDHCPFCLADHRSAWSDFTQIPNGIGGIEHRVDLIHQGVVAGHLSVERWVELCSTAPARMFGLDGRKGIIAPGADADVVIYDPQGTTTLGVATHHMRLDHSAFEGLTVTGRVESVWSRGELIVDAGRFLGRSGRGRYLRRGLSSVLR